MSIKFCATAQHAFHSDQKSGLIAVELDAHGPTRTIVSVISSSDGEAPKGSTTPAQRRWTTWAGFWRHRSSGPGTNTDALVAAWKSAWMKGAHAAWEAKPSNANPHAEGQARSAWDAGWLWAQQHADRRHQDSSRLAHRHRRANDSTPHLTRALQLGAVGVTVFWVSRAVHRWARGAHRES